MEERAAGREKLFGAKSVAGRHSPDWTLVPYVLPSILIELREYLTADGRGPYAAWFQRLSRESAVKVSAALARMQQGNFSNAKGVGAGVYEYRIEFGPDYRIYLGKDGDRMVILVGGGTKKRQE
jgi:putative addiction module killer protein